MIYSHGFLHTEQITREKKVFTGTVKKYIGEDLEMYHHRLKVIDTDVQCIVDEC